MTEMKGNKDLYSEEKIAKLDTFINFLKEEFELNLLHRQAWLDHKEKLEKIEGRIFEKE